ncbi:MAG: hypothetical protein KYX67_00130 [Brevundimonas sp.]|uniref:hypothetical protein n=1 Tax=Brevundimonas sp. TaxID=1871086 RepID=UPI001A1F1546|nr:hypothetical protein [Brevundimonas sp.]MBJ7317165.1 hypothetical protein [Brevundimonas sp.]MDK2745714.1 hypothetical protein [Brevundimonas sp.]
MRLALLILAGCSAPEAGPDAYVGDPERARRVVADCARGVARRDCDAARAALAEARRRDRMAAYAETFGDPRP